jgi:hypothetical protein
MKLTNVTEEKSRFGFWGKQPAMDDVLQQSAGKMFLNCDDPAFGEVIQKFLKEKFPNRSRFEKE